MNDLLHATQAELAARLVRGRRRGLFIWGAGAAGRSAVAALRSHGVTAKGVVDRDPARAGTVLDGTPVVAPAALAGCRPRPRVLIASIHWREIGAQLATMGFRFGRDVEVFPDDASGLAPASADAQRYAVWHRRWLERTGTGPIPGAPRVTPVAVPARLTRAALARLAASLPGDARWVVLHDARLRGVRWRWRRGAVPPPQVQAAPAAYDWPAPAWRDRERPFLLPALTAGATLGPVLLCRAGLVRAFASATRARVISADAFAAWLRDTGALQGGPFVGLCRPRVVAPPRGRTALRPHRALVPALVDFARETAASGAAIFSPEEIVDVLPAWTRERLTAESGLEYLGAGRPSGERPALQVVSHSQGNVFFREIRDVLAANWRRAGARVTVGDETHAPATAGRIVVVAPHEFFLLDGRDPAWDTTPGLVLMNTEQPQTRWFAAGLGRLLDSPLVFDINWQTALLLRALGVPAHFLPLGWDAHDTLGCRRAALPATGGLAGLDDAARALPASRRWRDRPIDVLFVGTLSPRRARAFAALAPVLARYRCVLHLPPAQRPLVPGHQDALDGRAMADLCRRARIVLNVHRDALPYCEWHRVVFQAMRQGALVVSEPMMPVPGFVPGTAFVAAPLTALPRVLRRLLDTPAGARRAARIASRGADGLRRRFPAERVAARTLALL